MPKRLAIFNDRAMQLHDALDGSTLAVKKKAAALQAAADELLPALFRDSKGNTDQEALDEARARLTHQFQSEYDSLSTATRDTWIDSILTIETAARLGAEEEMKIYAVTAKDSELASGDVSAFAGFFERRLREHNYDAGREKAQAFLLSPELNKPCELGPIRFIPEALRKHPNLGGTTMADIDKTAHENFRDRLLDRSDDILKELGLEGIAHGGALARSIVKDLLIKPQLNKLL